ncbi:MAG TPA: ThuA domain-containing protein [Terriglobales bacterium]|nr:ThuA domain-containing protein [Terriglobales bacterium]
MPADTTEKLQTLIITGQLSPEHDPKVNQLLRRVLESTGRFEVKITEEFHGATSETLAPYDLAIINYDGNFPFTNHPAVPMGAQAEKTILDFVQSGKGVFFYHSAVWCTPWTENVLRLMGGHCDPNKGSRKNPKLDFTIKNANPSHPIMQGLEPSWNTVTDDFFAGVVWHPEAKVEVLATVFDDVGDYANMPPHIAFMIPKGGPACLPGINQDHAVAWTNYYGKGRVVTFSIGHGIDTIRRRAFVPLFCRAAEWAATGKVTIAPPDLTGENRRRTWPYYSAMSIAEYSSIMP